MQHTQQNGEFRFAQTPLQHIIFDRAQKLYQNFQNVPQKIRLLGLARSKFDKQSNIHHNTPKQLLLFD